MNDINREAVLEQLNPSEAEQLQTFRALTTDIAEIEGAMREAPPDHKDRWQSLREQKISEIQEVAQTSTDLKALFMGVLAVEKTGGEERLVEVRTSYERLAKFEKDHDWLEKEGARIALLERVAPIKDSLLADAHLFVESLEPTSTTLEEGKKYQAVIDPEGIIVDDDILLWDLAYDPSQRGRNPLSREAVIQRCYHAGGLLLSANRVETDKGLQIVLINPIVRSMAGNNKLKGLFTTEGSSTPINVQIRNTFERSLDRVNDILRRNDKDRLFTHLRREHTAPYGTGYQINDEYGISFSEQAREFGDG